MRVGFVEWPEGLQPSGPGWARLAAQVADARLDLLITNELPFGRWIAADPAFDRDTARDSVAVHEAGLEALSTLPVPAVLSSRPVWAGDRLANEAFVLGQGSCRALHRKRYFPAEPGWFETAWYAPGGDGFRTADVAGLRVGVLLCTDAMFNEHARGYGRQNVALIAVPRATGASVEMWQAAGKMAAIVSGAYVISSNRVGSSPPGPAFGGGGSHTARMAPSWRRRHPRTRSSSPMSSPRSPPANAVLTPATSGSRMSAEGRGRVKTQSRMPTTNACLR